MTELRFVGVDPDSKGCQFHLLASSKQFNKDCYFSMDHASLVKCVQWLKSLEPVIIGIEGGGDYSVPLEAVLKKSGISFLGLPADRLADYRKAALGQNKSNKNDARSAALFLKMIHGAQLETSFKPREDRDSDLRQVTRSIYAMSAQVTFLKNRLWKLVRKVSQDLYIWLSGGTGETRDESRLDRRCVLRLLAAQPDVSKWSALSDSDFLDIMGHDGMKNRSNIVKGLRDSTIHAKPAKQYTQILLKQAASDVLHITEQLNDLNECLNNDAENNPAVKLLMQYKGFGSYIAASFVAEVGNIAWYSNDDHLASYAGFGRRNYSTGDRETMVKSHKYNRYLKNAVMQMSIHYVQWNKDTVLASLYRSLIKRGMKKIEAYRRIGRAFIRKFYILMKNVGQERSSVQSGKESMASRTSGNGHKDRLSNTLPSRTVAILQQNDNKYRFKPQEKMCMNT